MSSVAMPPSLHRHQDALDSLIDFLVLPHANDEPTGFVELAIGVTVSPNVRLELLNPPIPVVLRNGGMRWTRMPEAAVYIHGHLR